MAAGHKPILAVVIEEYRNNIPTTNGQYSYEALTTIVYNMLSTLYIYMKTRTNQDFKYKKTRTTVGHYTEKYHKSRNKNGTFITTFGTYSWINGRS